MYFCWIPLFISKFLMQSLIYLYLVKYILNISLGMAFCPIWLLEASAHFNIMSSYLNNIVTRYKISSFVAFALHITVIARCMWPCAQAKSHTNQCIWATTVYADRLCLPPTAHVKQYVVSWWAYFQSLCLFCISHYLYIFSFLFSPSFFISYWLSSS